MNYTTHESCRLCFSLSIEEILDFGETALANSFLDEPNQPEVTAPLKVFQCKTCGSVQLRHTVDPDVLFRNYLYESSTSAVFRKHFENYAQYVTTLLKPKSVLDIGSNCGYLLKCFKDLGCKVTGVEPATNLANKANAAGLTTINDFFNIQLARTLGKFDIITANNVFAHINNLHEIIAGVKECLNPGGLFIFENAYWLDTVNNLYFDQIYHEHIFYHSIKPLAKLFMSHGMEICDVQRNNIQGGTIRVFVWKNEDAMILPQVQELIDQEEKLYNPQTYVEFNQKLTKLRGDLHWHLRRYETVAAFGAPAKFTTFCKVMGVSNEFDFVVDDAPLKQNKYTPGTHIKVHPKEYLLEKQPDACVITAWNFADSIIKNNPGYKGAWIVPMPEVKCIYNA